MKSPRKKPLAALAAIALALSGTLLAGTASAEETTPQEVEGGVAAAVLAALEGEENPEEHHGEGILEEPAPAQEEGDEGDEGDEGEGPQSGDGGEGGEGGGEDIIQIHVDGRDYASDLDDHPTSCDEGEPFALDFRDGQTPLLTLCGEEDLADIAGIWSQSDLDIEVQRAAEVRPGFDDNWAIQIGRASCRERV